MNCPQCSKPISETAKFCPHCGAARRVEVAPEPVNSYLGTDHKTCPRCEAVCVPGAKFCPACSYAFLKGGVVMPEPVDPQPPLKGAVSTPEAPDAVEFLVQAAPEPDVHIASQSALSSDADVQQVNLVQEDSQTTKGVAEVSGHARSHLVEDISGNSASPALWKKLLLAFVLFLIAIGVATWYFMKSAEDRVIKDDSEIPIVKKENPDAGGNVAEDPHEEVISSGNEVSVLPSLETPKVVPAEKSAEVVVNPVSNAEKPKNIEKPQPAKKVTPSVDRSVIY